MPSGPLSLVQICLPFGHRESDLGSKPRHYPRFCGNFKRIPLGVIVIARFKYFHSRYIYFYKACLACCSLHVPWLALRAILLSGGLETNPGPAALDFCTWNLNSIASHDFSRVSLIVAYSSVCNYDLIGNENYLSHLRRTMVFIS